MDERACFQSLEQIADEYAAKGKKRVRYVLYDRESGGTQYRNGNAAARKMPVRIKIEEGFLSGGLECEFTGYFYEEHSGWSDCLEGRLVLLKAIQKAKKHDAILIAPTCCRFVRSIDHHRFAPLRECDIKAFMDFVGEGVVLAVVTQPGTPLRKTNGKLSKWGQVGKDNKGGRPAKKPKHPAGYMKARRKRLKGEVFQLYLEVNSFRKVAAVLKNRDETVSKNTVGRWVESMKNEKNP